MVQSEVGRGTTFQLYLPVAPPELEKTVTSTPFEKKGAGEKILILDPDATVRDALRLTLEKSGYAVEVAAEPWPAIEAAQREKSLALFITEIALPGMPGLEMIGRVRSLHPKLPIVAISSLTNPKLQSALAEAVPGSDYLAKPIAAQTLLTSVRQMLKTP